ncbi:Spx/MgsR family RNA polymerase-binding regulatory protein [Catenisphaera adipataccumulans]|uniref:Regulatory protein spx n=1 Tax=Catenisphaera adipataccumulans TaxID=700500 RepID=A0A7W8CZH3_9FIRM|nr:Spx/MgsR family RNA polymerase-binding regulatory protein [Catenisphaera adipataccumulans]MBB5183303.1 regulatory protein spx [Catenisphaera adipataccumulans]
MVIIYTSPGCASCRKAKQWLKNNHIEFVEKNIFKSILNEDEIKYILSRSENGTEDVISVRSKAFQALKKQDKDIDDLSMKELAQLIQENPSILRRPIMISEKSFVVGYDDDEITTMMTPSMRRAIDDSCNPSCPNYAVCGSVRKDCDEKAGQLHLETQNEKTRIPA